MPSQVEELVQDLSEDALRWRPSPQEWSIKEVCCHLRDFSEIGGERIRRMLNEDQPFLPSYDQESLASDRDYQNERMPLVLTALRAFSGGLAYLLENLSEEGWQRTARPEGALAGMRPGAAERHVISIAQYAQLLADHGREHLEQIRALRQQLPPGL
ncbi:MAG: DinB family protein [Dehalococcoidia bacterium]